MSSSIKVARYHLVYPFMLVLAPWAVLALAFVST